MPDVVLLIVFVPTGAAVTSELLGAEVLLRRVEELQGGVVGRTARVFMVIWSTGEDGDKRSLHIKVFLLCSRHTFILNVSLTNL